MTSRAASRVASATSRSPPSGDRPASAASARKRNRGVESAYGGKATGTGGTRRIYRPTDPRQRGLSFRAEAPPGAVVEESESSGPRGLSTRRERDSSTTRLRRFARNDKSRGRTLDSGMVPPAKTVLKSVLWVDDEVDLLESHRIFLR